MSGILENISSCMQSIDNGRVLSSKMRNERASTGTSLRCFIRVSCHRVGRIEIWALGHKVAEPNQRWRIGTRKLKLVYSADILEATRQHATWLTWKLSAFNNMEM